MACCERGLAELVGRRYSTVRGMEGWRTERAAHPSSSCVSCGQRSHYHLLDWPARVRACSRARMLGEGKRGARVLARGK